MKLLTGLNCKLTNNFMMITINSLIDSRWNNHWLCNCYAPAESFLYTHTILYPLLMIQYEHTLASA